MANKYQKVIDEIAKAEKSQWTIGELLIECCGTPGNDPNNDGSYVRIGECRLELEAAGFDYSFETLRELRDVAYRFDPRERSQGCSWSLHRNARDPVTLKAFDASLPPEAKRTVALMQLFRQKYPDNQDQWAQAVKELYQAKIAITAASMTDKLKIDPTDKQAAMYGINALRDLVRNGLPHSPAAVKRGALSVELAEARQLIAILKPWIAQLEREIGQ